MRTLLVAVFVVCLAGKAVAYGAKELWRESFPTVVPAPVAAQLHELRADAGAPDSEPMAITRAHAPVPLRPPYRKPVVVGPRFRTGDCEYCVAPIPGGPGPGGIVYYQAASPMHPLE